MHTCSVAAPVKVLKSHMRRRMHAYMQRCSAANGSQKSAPQYTYNIKTRNAHFSDFLPVVAAPVAAKAGV